MDFGIWLSQGFVAQDDGVGLVQENARGCSLILLGERIHAR